MALLRLRDGRIYTTLDGINAHIGSMQVGSFAFDEAARARMEALPHPLSRDDAETVVAMLGDARRAALVEDGYVSWRIGDVNDVDGQFEFVLHYQEGGQVGAQRSGTDLRAYLDPHRAEVEDIHFVFAGAIVKGYQLPSGEMGVIYVLPGEWLSVGSTILAWPIFPAGGPTTGLSFYSKPAGPGSPWEVHRPEFDVPAELAF